MLKDKQLIAKIALKILKTKNWNNISLDEIKKKSKVKSFDRLINNKQDVLKNINNYFDYNLSLISKNIEKSNNKDMIFEVLMMRFDILQNYRNSVISIFDSFKKKPQNIMFLLPDILESIILMISYTNISCKGVLGRLKIKGILVIYISSFLVWMKDDSPSLEKTMTTLDNYLNQAGKILNFVE